MQTQTAPNPTARTSQLVMPTYGHHIAQTPNAKMGRPRLAGRRITVADVASWHLKQGLNASQIARAYHLTRAQVHAALAYYFDHKAEIDRQEAAARRLAQAMPAIRSRKAFEAHLQTMRGQRGTTQSR